MDVREWFLNELRNSSDPRDAIILKLEENPNLKYVRTDTYLLNKTGVIISDEEFDKLSRYKKKQCTMKFVRVYIDKNGLETTDKITA